MGNGCWGKKLNLRVWVKKMKKKGKGEREKGEKQLINGLSVKKTRVEKLWAIGGGG